MQTEEQTRRQKKRRRPESDATEGDGHDGSDTAPSKRKHRRIADHKDSKDAKHLAGANDAPVDSVPTDADAGDAAKACNDNDDNRDRTVSAQDILTWINAAELSAPMTCQRVLAFPEDQRPARRTTYACQCASFEGGPSRDQLLDCRRQISDVWWLGETLTVNRPANAFDQAAAKEALRPYVSSPCIPNPAGDLVIAARDLPRLVRFPAAKELIELFVRLGGKFAHVCYARLGTVVPWGDAEAKRTIDEQSGQHVKSSTSPLKPKFQCDAHIRHRIEIAQTVTPDGSEPTDDYREKRVAFEGAHKTHYAKCYHLQHKQWLPAFNELSVQDDIEPFMVIVGDVVQRMVAGIDAGTNNAISSDVVKLIISYLVPFDWKGFFQPLLDGAVVLPVHLLPVRFPDNASSSTHAPNYHSHLYLPTVPTHFYRPYPRSPTPPPSSTSHASAEPRENHKDEQSARDDVVTQSVSEMLVCLQNTQPLDDPDGTQFENKPDYVYEHFDTVDCRCPVCR